MYGQLATDRTVSLLSSPSTVVSFSLPSEHWKPGNNWGEDIVVDVAAGDVGSRRPLFSARRRVVSTRRLVLICSFFFFF